MQYVIIIAILFFVLSTLKVTNAMHLDILLGFYAVHVSQAIRLHGNTPAGQRTNNAWQSAHIVSMEGFSCCSGRCFDLGISSLRRELPLNHGVVDYPVFCGLIGRLYGIQHSAAWMHQTHASIINASSSNRSSWQTIHSFWLLAVGFVATGLIASALQIPRIQRVLLHRAPCWSEVRCTVYSEACTVNNDSYSSDCVDVWCARGCH